jgi:hypothetical protein
MTENSKPQLETTEKTQSCSKLRPICLRVPKGKKKMEKKCAFVDIKDMSYNTVDQLDRIAKYFDNTDTNKDTYKIDNTVTNKDTDIIDKFKIVEFVDKKIVRYVGDDNLQNCYSIELSWFIIIKDIIKQLDEIGGVIDKEKKENTGDNNVKATAKEAKAEAEAESKIVIENYIQNINNELKSIDNSRYAIDLYEIFNGIFEFGKKKWEILIDNKLDIKVDIKVDEKKETNIVNIYNKFINPNVHPLKSDKKMYTDQDLISIEKNIDAKNHIIAYLILCNFKNFIVSDGFKKFSFLIKNPSTLAKVNESVMKTIPKEGMETASLGGVEESFDKLKQMLEITLLLMNEKKDLTNMYNNEKMVDIYEKIYNEFDVLNMFFANYNTIVGDDVLVPASQTGGFKFTDPKKIGLGLGLLSFAIYDMTKGGIYSLIWGAIKGTWYHYLLPVFSFLSFLVPFVNIIACAVGTSLLLYNLGKITYKYLHTVEKNYERLQKNIENYNKKENNKEKNNIISQYNKLTVQIVKENIEEKLEKKKEAEKIYKKDMKNIINNFKKNMKNCDVGSSKIIEGVNNTESVIDDLQNDSPSINKIDMLKKLKLDDFFSHDNGEQTKIEDIIKNIKDLTKDAEDGNICIKGIKEIADKLSIAKKNIDDAILDYNTANELNIPDENTDIEDIKDIIKITQDIDQFKKIILDNKESQGGGLISSRKSYEIKHQQKNGRRRKYTLKKMRKRCKSSKHENSRRKIKRFKKKIHKSSGRKSSGRKSSGRKSSGRKSTR